MTSNTYPNISAVTLGVRDVEASRSFYVEGLGFPLLWHSEGEIAFVQVGPGLMLSLWNVDSMPGEYGDVGYGELAPPISIGHNTASDAEVRRLFELAVAAGATVIGEPAQRPWGGISACVADPDGFRWDFVHNPGFGVAADGTITMA